jgi:hypothetical protein
VGALEEAHLTAVCEKDAEILLSKKTVNCWRITIFRSPDKMGPTLRIPLFRDAREKSLETLHLFALFRKRLI